MALLEPGYWPSTYWPSRYWPTNPQYWPEYGAVAPSAPSVGDKWLGRDVATTRRRRRKPFWTLLQKALSLE